MHYRQILSTIAAPCLASWVALSCLTAAGNPTAPSRSTGGSAGLAASGGGPAPTGGASAGGGVSGAGGGSSTGGVPAPTGGASGTPAMGAHTLAFTLDGKVSADALTTPAIDTQPSGSTLLVALARGQVGNFGPLPSDNKGNSPYALVGSVESYARWPQSGTALYAFTSAVGGRGHTVTITRTSLSETTVFVIEVKNAGRVQDARFRQVAAGGTLTSASVTTTGPATLVAFCWGDAGGQPSSFTVGDGFTIVEQQPLSEISIEGAAAVKNVAAAGSYSVTWKATQGNSSMGALMYLVALGP